MADNYLVLSRKWRPQTFNDVVGQVHVTQTLQNALKQNRLGHGYLFTGSRGVGKTSVARILSRVVNCLDVQNHNPCNSCTICVDILKGSNFDVIELDGASNRGIDEIRDLRESVKYPPSSGKYKVYIIDEVHMLTKEAFNALLKTLEEPPSHVLFILATTDPHKIPQTILSRTQRFSFKRISIDEINSYLVKILKSEEKTFDDESIKLISNKADGSMRDALSLLDQVIAYSDDSINAESISQSIGLINDTIYCDILSCIVLADLSKMLNIVSKSINSGHSITDFMNGFIDFLNKYIHMQVSDEHDKKISLDKDVLDCLSIDLIIQILESSIKFENRLKFMSQPMIALETHFVKLTYIYKKPALDLKNKSSNVVIESNNKPSKVIIETDDSDVEKQEQSSVSNHSDSSIDKKQAEIIKNSFENKNQQLESDDETPDSDNKSEKISLDTIVSKWKDLISEVEQKHPKTASFLEDVSISDYNDQGKLVLMVNGSQFHMNSLENDVEIINKELFDFFDKEIEVCFKMGDSVKEENNSEKPKQHPLLSKAIDSLNGEIIN